jgi:hypothetical protein
LLLPGCPRLQSFLKAGGGGEGWVQLLWERGGQMVVGGERVIVKSTCHDQGPFTHDCVGGGKQTEGEKTRALAWMEF